MSSTIPEPLDADDPGLTAYALGELDGPEAARYAELIAASPALQACVEEIRSAARMLTNELAREPEVALPLELKTEITTRCGQCAPTPASAGRRFPLSARQAAAVAASIALIPGAWYAFQAAFPRPGHDAAKQVASHTPSAVRGSGKSMADDSDYAIAVNSSPDRTSVLQGDGVDESLATVPRQSAPNKETLIAAAEGRPRSDFGESDLSVPAPAIEEGQHPQSVRSIALPGDKPSNRDPESKGEGKESRERFSNQSGIGIGGRPGMKNGGVSEGIPSDQPGQPKGGVTVESVPQPGVATLKGNQKDVDKPVGEIRDLEKAERSEGEASRPLSSKPGGKPGSAANPGPSGNESAPVSASITTSPAGLSKSPEISASQSRSKYSESQKSGLDSSPSATPAAPGGAVGGPAAPDKKEMLLLTDESKRKRALDGRNAAPVQRNPDGSRVTTAGKPLTVDGYALGESKPIVRGREMAAAESKKIEDRLAQKESGAKTEPRFAVVDEAEKAGDQVDKSKDRLIALAEVERLRKMPLGEISKKDVERFGWAKRELGWQEWDGRVANEAYNPIFENSFINPAEQPLSTFSIDVDTASYSNLRRFLQNGQLPPPDAVRIEELVNYFSYQYPQPEDGRPFSVQTDIAACPWQPGHQLVRVGLKGREIPREQRPPTNLVFLVDVSGSMSAQNKLPLVRESLTTLVKQLDERDKIAIVTYAGEAGVRLPATSVAQRDVILNAINGLGAGGSTNGAAGINTAYDIAAQEFIEKGTNRVILCTDGDFNVGVTSDDALVQMIQTRAKGGVFLSIFGFGMGNLKDAKLEQLADKGNGQYGYIDDTQEANKVFVQELMGTLVTIAKDVKIQIDFNKEAVSAYRLVGYENRVMAAEDFHNDKKDAGEIGAGHTVTALYQIVPAKELKVSDETRWLTVKLRYKQPEASTSVLIENPIIGNPGQLKLASSDFQFAASVAATGMLLRHSQYAGQANWGLIKELAQSGLSFDPHGHRRGFLNLIAQAESLMGQIQPVSPPAPDATVRGKYKSLLRRLNVPEDSDKYGQYNDYGYSETKTYGGADNLPAGFWVYAAPYWYIWAESNEQAGK